MVKVPINYGMPVRFFRLPKHGRKRGTASIIYQDIDIDKMSDGVIDKAETALCGLTSAAKKCRRSPPPVSFIALSRFSVDQPFICKICPCRPQGFTECPFDASAATGYQSRLAIQVSHRLSSLFCFLIK